MNLARILRVTSWYLFLTGYQIRWYDRKSLHYRLTFGGIIYFLILFILYLICFCHHFESSSMMKILLDISPFLKNVVRLQVLLGLIVYMFCAIEGKNLTKIFNGLLNVFTQDIKCLDVFDISEVCVYLLFFATLVLGFAIGLYIAIELNFVLPSLDQIMITMALFGPHFTLAGCLRFYTLGLWLMKRELDISETYLKYQEVGKSSKKLETIIVIEIFNPVLNTNSCSVILYRICDRISKHLDKIAEYLNVFDSILQRQLSVLVGMNFNCLLAGAYTHIYFENKWKILFTNRNRRIFYAANSGIFICILVDYGILLLTRWKFCRAKQNLHNLIEARLFGNSNIESDIKHILWHIKRKLSRELKLNLFGLVEFNTWTFLVLQCLMISLIALIVSHQYLNDQIKVLDERLDLNDSE